jgi:hypothetical protein
VSESAVPSAPASPAVPAAPVEAKATPEKAPAPVVDGKPAPEVAAAPKRKVKVDGKELEVTDDELVKGYQLESTARARLAAAAKQADEVKALEAKLKSGGVEALRAAGWTDDQIEELSIAVLSEKQQAMLEQERVKALDPKERELEDLRKFKAEQEKAAKDKQQSEHQQQVSQAQSLITGAVIDTLELFPEKYRGSEILAGRVVTVWESALEQAEELTKQGIQVTPRWVADKVAAEFRGLSREVAAHAKDDELDDLIPPATRARLAKKQAAAALAAEHPALTAVPQIREGSDRESEGEKKPRVTQSQLLRRVTLGG